MKTWLVIASTFLLAACSSSDERDQAFGTVPYSVSDDDSTNAREEFDEDAARARAATEVASEGYEGPCTSDCSGHDAGFSWAADGNPDYGSSRSRSFDEGQEAYKEAVDQRVEQYREDFESGDDGQ